MSSAIEKLLLDAAIPGKAADMQRFFKTGPGEYGEGDRFIGLTTPIVRGFAKQFRALPLDDLHELLESPYHEARSLALLILTLRFAKADSGTREKIYRFYLSHAGRINNWDLVDISAPKIVGEYLLDHDRTILDRLSGSSNLWEQRIAMVSTLTFIRNGELDDTLRLAVRLLNHPHDLMHKACGWMLREAGKRDRVRLTAFLLQYKDKMPRTMLRYAIEHYPEAERKAFLQR